MFNFSMSSPVINLGGKSFATVFILLAISLQAQRDYSFNYHSRYDLSGSGVEIENAETSVFDNSQDSSYQLVLYPNEARIKDERTDELHYFKIINEQDSIRYQYDYSLKVNFALPFKTVSIQVKRITDVDYEISYIKKNERAEGKEKILLCLQENDADLLDSNYSGQANSEMKLIMDRLRLQLPADRNFYIADLVYQSGRFTRNYRRTAVQPVNLTLSIPTNIVYKNSFLKKK